MGQHDNNISNESGIVDDCLKVMIIPGLFPKAPNDICGIYILDYLKALRGKCKSLVFDTRLTGEKGLSKERMEDTVVLRCAVSGKPVHGVIKVFLYLLWLAKSLFIALKMNGFHIIHAHGCTVYGSLALLIARLKAIPVVVTEHCGPFSALLRRPLNRILTHYVCSRVDMLCLVSNDLKRQVELSGVRARRMLVTYNPIDPQAIVPGTNPEKQKKILFVGRLEPYKGGFRAARSFTEIAEQFPDWSLDIIGEGPDASTIQEFIDMRPSLKSRIFLTGRLSKAEVAKKYASASILLHPSERETFGLVVAEAMLAGLPVVIGDRIGATEFVDEECGLAVPAYDIPVIAKALKHVIEHRSQYDCEAIRAKVAARFGTEVIGKKLLSIYQSLL